ncbi:GcrA family cell cycle regulator [Azospirillum melinis]|uniref:GcrA family cell cycle regulator n=1 Tax=Azospirillum melinis TaxID=328839 RepID=UPI003756766C
MNRASSAPLVFDPLLVALADVADRPGMPPASVGKLHPAVAAPRPVRRKARIVAPAPRSFPAPVEIIAAPPPAKPRAAIIVGQQQKRRAAEKGSDGRPIRPYAIRPGFIAAPAKTCQWIEGTPSPDDSCKCLAPSAPGVSYCPAHAQRAYRVLPRGVAAAFPLISPSP